MISDILIDSQTNPSFDLTKDKTIDFDAQLRWRWWISYHEDNEYDVGDQDNDVKVTMIIED